MTDRKAFSQIICLVWTLFVLGGTSGCSILATRPVQEMSDTAAAIKAAREVQADTLTPELFRQASEWFNLARREYKYKNFNLAIEYAKKAKSFAEEAEFQSIRGGANRDTNNSETPPAAKPDANASVPAQTSLPPADTSEPPANAAPQPSPNPAP